MVNKLMDYSSKTQEYYGQSRPEIVGIVDKDIKSILDIGCSDGSFIKELKNKIPKLKSVGIELNDEFGQKAKQILNKVFISDVCDAIPNIKNGDFDVITFNDVLEHMVDPYDVLSIVKPKLSTNGKIIASIPNVRFFKNLYNLLFKKDWQYEDHGILDRTHLRFFTKKSIIAMFEQTGYRVISIQGINKSNTWKKN